MSYIEKSIKGPLERPIVLNSLNKLVSSWDPEKRRSFLGLHSQINNFIAGKPKEIKRFQKVLNNWVESETDPYEKLHKVFNDFLQKMINTLMIKEKKIAYELMREKKRIAKESRACLVYIDAIMKGLIKYKKNNTYKDNSVGNPIKGPIVLDSLNKLLSLLRPEKRKVYANLQNRVAGVFTAKYSWKLINQLLNACIHLKSLVNPEIKLPQKKRLMFITKEIIETEFINATKQPGFLKINYSKRNIYATVTDFQGEILGTTTTGLLKAGRGRRRNLLLNIKKTASNTVRHIFKSKLTDIIFVQKGKTFNKKRRTFKKIVLRGTSKDLIVSDLIRPAVREHNGSRPVKVRRR
jgi:ribosomal protein S11